MAIKIKMPLVIKILLGSAFLMNAGTFMVIPFLVVYLSNSLNLSPIEVGTILSANLFFGRLLPFITGLLGDRVSHSTTLLLGICLRGIGFIGYGFFESFAGLLMTSALVGIGGAFYDPSIMSVFASQNEKERKQAFTYLNQALNAGAILGPLFAAGLLLYNPTGPFLTSGLILILIAIVLSYFTKYIETKKSKRKLVSSIKQIISNKAYIKYILTMIIFWVVFSQLSVSIPLYVYYLTDDEKMISAIYMVNGLAGLAFMFFLRGLYIKYESLSLISRGSLIIGISLLILPLIGSFPWLLFAIVLFTLGETLILPSSDMAIADYSKNEDTGGYYGLFELSFAAGTIIGTYLGTLLMEINQVYPWYLYGGLSLFMFVLIGLLKKDLKSESIEKVQNKVEV